MSFDEAVDLLVGEPSPAADVDELIGRPGYVGVRLTNNTFAPETSIGDARQRWLFRLIHATSPLREKMALFWHNHFATAYSKVSGIYGSTEATRMMAAKPSEDPGGVRGQIETLRQLGLGNFRDLLVAMAQDPAMLVWLDGRLNTRTRPQENFGREIMELFTMGVGFHTEEDVYAAARVFTGWNLQRVGTSGDPAARYVFVYNASQHDTAAKTFSFPIYTSGSRTIPGRAASDGLQDGLDLIDALVRHAETPRRLARRLWGFFVSDLDAADEGFIAEVGGEFVRSGYDMRATVRSVLLSSAFRDSRARLARYSWPVEFVVRAIREIGWSGFVVGDALTPLSNMGQVLFEPPDVAGWELGPAWFTSGTMLARANFASTLVRNQRSALAVQARAANASARRLLYWVLDRLPSVRIEGTEAAALESYLLGSGPWTGSDAQLQVKVPGLVHLVAGSAQYQFV